MEGHRQWRLYNTLYNHQRPSNPPTPMSATPPFPHMSEVVRSGLLSSRPVSSMWSHWRKSERCTMLHGGLSWEGQQPTFQPLLNARQSSCLSRTRTPHPSPSPRWTWTWTWTRGTYLSRLNARQSSCLLRLLFCQSTPHPCPTGVKIQLTKKDKYGLQNLRNPCHRNLRIRLPKAQVVDSTTYVCSLSWLL